MRRPTGQAAGAATRRLLPVGDNGLNPAGEPIKGIAAAHALPHTPFSKLWEAILLDGDQKDRLLAQAVLSFTLRPRVEPGSVTM